MLLCVLLSTATHTNRPVFFFFVCLRFILFVGRTAWGKYEWFLTQAKCFHSIHSHFIKYKKQFVRQSHMWPQRYWGNVSCRACARCLYLMQPSVTSQWNKHTHTLCVSIYYVCICAERTLLGFFFMTMSLIKRKHKNCRCTFCSAFTPINNNTIYLDIWYYFGAQRFNFWGRNWSV